MKKNPLIFTLAILFFTYGNAFTKELSKGEHLDYKTNIEVRNKIVKVKVGDQFLNLENPEAREKFQNENPGVKIVIRYSNDPYPNKVKIYRFENISENEFKSTVQYNRSNTTETPKGEAPEKGVEAPVLEGDDKGKFFTGSEPEIENSCELLSSDIERMNHILLRLSNEKEMSKFIDGTVAQNMNDVLEALVKVFNETPAEEGRKSKRALSSLKKIAKKFDKKEFKSTEKAKDSLVEFARKSKNEADKVCVSVALAASSEGEQPHMAPKVEANRLEAPVFIQNINDLERQMEEGEGSALAR